MRNSAPFAFGALLVLGACGGGQTRVGRVFDTNWQDDGGKSIGSVQSRLASYQIPIGANLAVGVSSQGLRGLDLDTGKAWSFSHTIDARPTISGSVVVGAGGGELFALDARSGQKLWARASAGALLGMGDDGRTTLVSLGISSNSPATLLAIARDGSVVRQIEAGVSLGTPALVANLAFIPWQNQYVTVYDLSSGDEVARVTLRQQTSRAAVTGGALYFGELGLTRFDQNIAAASKNEANYVTLPSRELPGSPRWLRQGGYKVGTQADAFDKIRLYARPSDAKAPLGIDSNRYFATYYHVLLGLEAKTGELRWAKTATADISGGAAYVGGFAACMDDGRVAFFDAETGRSGGEMSMGEPIQSCVVQADSLSRPVSGARDSLVTQLALAIEVRETEMVMMQRFLLRELLAQTDEAATKKLIDLASDRRTSPVLLPDVRSGLAARRNGASFMLEALGKRYDYLKDVLVGPPVGPMADALAAMGEGKAAPLLAELMLDPVTEPEDVKRAVLALTVLATESELGALQTFFSLYRCSDQENLAESAVLAAKAMRRVGGEKVTVQLRTASLDPLTNAAVRESLRAMLRTADGK